MKAGEGLPASPSDAPDLGIWKYSAPLDDLRSDEVSFEMPGNSKVLSVGRQGNDLVVWVAGRRYGRVPDMADSEIRRFRIGTTGNSARLEPRYEDGRFPPGVEFVGTVQFEEYGLVFHVFDLGPVKE